MKKVVILIIISIIFISSAVYLYLNNDLFVNNLISNTGGRAAETAKNEATPSEPQGNAPLTTMGTDSTGIQDEATLDTVFGAEESADNFDDLVL
jgi:hypothetical protein